MIEDADASADASADADADVDTPLKSFTPPTVASQNQVTRHLTSQATGNRGLWGSGHQPVTVVGRCTQGPPNLRVSLLTSVAIDGQQWSAQTLQLLHDGEARGLLQQRASAEITRDYTFIYTKANKALKSKVLL